MSELRSGWALAMLALAMAGGCVKTRPTMTTTRPEPESQPTADLSGRVREISRLAEEYDSLARQLPGRTPQEHRELMRKVFTELGQILPLLQDPKNDLVFRQQLSIIQECRTQLANAASDLAVEPTIDTGLRATLHAFSGIAQDGYYNQSELTPLIDQMSAKVDDLDTVHGLTHPVVVAEAVELSSGIVSKMGDELAQRINNEASSTTSPTAVPATTEPAPTSPTAAPEPATAPSTKPAEPVATPTPAPATSPAAPDAVAPVSTEPATKEAAPAPDPNK